jgi:hypothetical protein
MPCSCCRGRLSGRWWVEATSLCKSGPASCWDLSVSSLAEDRPSPVTEMSTRRGCLYPWGGQDYDREPASLSVGPTARA